MKTFTIVLVMISVLLTSGRVSAAVIQSMTISDAEFYIAHIGPGTGYVTGPDTNLVGGYIGTGGSVASGASCNIDAPVCFQLFGVPVQTYTAASNLGDSATPAGIIDGGPVPTGTVQGGKMLLDVSSFFIYWKDDYNQGRDIDGNTVTASTDWSNSADFTGAGLPESGSVSCLGSTCTFTNLRWEAYFNGGVMSGSTGFWSLSGTATVPVPSAAWLMLTGLIGLIGMTRKKTQTV